MGIARGKGEYRPLSAEQRRKLVECIREFETDRLRLMDVLASMGEAISEITVDLVLGAPVATILGDARGVPMHDQLVDALSGFQRTFAAMRGRFHDAAVREGATLAELASLTGLTRQTIAGLIRRIRR
jgi:hypothetical protein